MIKRQSKNRDQADKIPTACYDAPKYWDLAFADETTIEADFIQAAASRYLSTESPHVLEIGCGGGRQVIELAHRGLSVSGLDLNASCVAFAQQRLARRRLTAEIFCADMTSFRIAKPVQLAHCLVNTFRHVIDENSAIRHLKCVAASLEPHGIYLLGFHLLPPDAAEEDCERWTVHHRGTRITTTIRVLSFDRRSRVETVRFSLKVTRRNGILRFSSDFPLRIYRADQFRKLLKSVPEFDLVDVFDFCYDLTEPLPLDDQLGDAVFVLRRRR
ncbi:MAG: class I SAM-dependent methyltransferase [Planctomycetota bacterium]